jgi:hypothetical protein
MALKYPDKITAIKGEPKPDGWFGKSWACHQLSLAPKSELLLFVDADVVLEKTALSNAVALLEQHRASLVTCFPTQIMKSVGEHLVVPLMDWILLSMLTLHSVHSSKNPLITAANGQFMLFEKSAYDKIGGHCSVRNELVEDIEIARTLKKKKFRVVTTLGNKLVFCRMYENGRSAVKGIGRSLYAGLKVPFGFGALFLVSVWVVNVMPFLFVFINRSFMLPVILSLLNAIILAIIVRQSPLRFALLKPIIITVILPAFFYTHYLAQFKIQTWKGRQI